MNKFQLDFISKQNSNFNRVFTRPLTASLCVRGGEEFLLKFFLEI